MNDSCRDLLDEYQDLAALAQTLGAEEWARATDFHGWSAWDEIAHLCFFDEASLLAIGDADAFQREALELGRLMAAGGHISAVARERYRGLDGPALLARWRQRHEALVAGLAALDARHRLPWYGPPMSARSFATARLMETWAHGQDIWDALGRRRPASVRLRHIAHLGVGTFGWTFVNRGQPVPEPMPYVELAAPDGATWQWGEPSARHYVRGTAEDFCLLVTQRRHLDDTALAYSEGAATQWLAQAQCFAGPPADGPAAGTRARRVAAGGAG
ncbi:TIGR03084 family protein [Cupriavidus sp. USMAA2-4]|uniref:TIGR03084 family metal-binding protein n=1 Tax=Cupriavidus sp. USMAA2-4 TaxID=876364 RepID=UPI0008A68C79|nr:TIGR03084 family metal-binding protein [Cupriavidus sp. USMAA2-4]AOY91165.1 TIGR03084 family protein [Cupriavidus sp. USMAA2-4]